ncbi:MAG: PD40 domain-containing protein [Anaerolineales bacterium]|nr:PD40 domain-containing protein [Anaerolineales bacterium]
MRSHKLRPLITALACAVGALAACSPTAATSTPIASPTSIPATEEATQALAQPEHVLGALQWSETSFPSGPAKVLDGWANGLRASDYCETGPYRWLDSEHLMLFPVVGQTQVNEVDFSNWTHPIVVSVDGSPSWALSLPQEFCSLPTWSAALERVIEADEASVQLRTLAGDVTATHPGSLPLSLSPSGLRLLAGTTWLDLETGQTATLSDAWGAAGFFKIAWSADELRLFGCCFHYADVGSGDAWEQESYNELTVVGRGSWPGEEVAARALWVSGDEQAVIDTLAIQFMLPTSVVTALPVFLPAENSIIDLRTVLPDDLPDLCPNRLAPQATALWVSCPEQNAGGITPAQDAYLISLPSLQVTILSTQPQLLAWSADGRYALYRQNSDVATSLWILDTTTIINTQLPAPVLDDVAWHPERPLALLFTPGRQDLLVVDAASSLRRNLTAELPVRAAIWQPQASGLVLLAQDGSLWWLADALDPDSLPEQLTPSLPNVHSIRWSPDGRWLAFVSEGALYLIEPATQGEQP